MCESDTKVLSLFSGIGGLDIGAQAVGLRTTLAVDQEAEALRLLESAVGCQTLQADLTEISPADVAARAGIKEADPLILIGGPPCTGFSHAGFWLDRKRNGSDPAVTMLDHYGRFISALKPMVWVLENVPGLTFKNFRSHLKSFVEPLEKHYSISQAVLNAADFGVPQERRRLFIVGVRDCAFKFVFPEPMFAPSERRTAGWAFEGLDDEINPPESDERLTGKYAHLLPEVPAGQNYLFFTEKRGYHDPKFRWRSRYWSFLKKLSPNEPSNTVPATRVTNNGPFHWENRHLRIREMARLQGFPDSLALEPTDRHRRFVGNAVPPLLATSVIAALARQIPEFQRSHGSGLDAAFHPESSPALVGEVLSSGASGLV